MVHGLGLRTTSEPKRWRWKVEGGGSFFSGRKVSDLSGEGEGSARGGGNTFGRNVFKLALNFVASSAEANSIAISASGRSLDLLLGHVATKRREVITSSACVFSHLTTALNSFGGLASFKTGSSRSLIALERMSCPAPRTSP